MIAFVSATPLVKRSLKIPSCDAPKKANGAINAPELVPYDGEFGTISGFRPAN
jgi:hypothetical protein